MRTLIEFRAQTPPLLALISPVGLRHHRVKFWWVSWSQFQPSSVSLSFDGLCAVQRSSPPSNGRGSGLRYLQLKVSLAARVI